MNNLNDYNRLFPNEDSCLQYLSQVRWNGIVTSPFSPTGKVYECSNGQYRCRDTSRYFTAKTGTIFQHSRLPLRTWFRAIWLMQQNPSITSVALAKELEITQKSAWLMQQRVRKQLGIRKSRATHEIQKSADDAVNKLNLVEWLSSLKK
jgi:transposase-like protein